MSTLKNQVLTLLTEVQGSVEEVTRRLPVSRSYVNRLKSEEWTPTTSLEQPKELAVSPSDYLGAILPPNITGVSDLRDATIEELHNLVTTDAGMMEPKELISLLGTILQYETRLGKLLRPAMNVYNDNRSVSVEVQDAAKEIADNLTVDELRQIAGVDAPMNIIDGDQASD